MTEMKAENCTKCGSKDVKVKWVEPQFSMNMTTPGYLKCKCNRCGHYWDEE